MRMRLLVFIMLFLWVANIIEASEVVRGLWLVRDEMTSPQRIEEALSIAEKGGFNTLFVQARGRGFAFYQSQNIPRSPLIEAVDSLNGAFDPLAFAVKKAHERGFKVHVWLNVLFTWSSPEAPVDSHHVFLTNPRWFMVGRDGTRPGESSYEKVSDVGWFLSPGIPEVRHYLTGIVREIVKNYEVDGIHLDYIRYPDERFDFHPVVRGEFNRLYGSDPVRLFSDHTSDSQSSVTPTESTYQNIEKWYEFRTLHVTQLVKMISQAIRSEKRPVMLSCAVKPQVEEAYVIYGQDWVHWLNEGLVDFVCPMSYTTDNEILLRNTRYALEKVKRASLVVGLGAHLVDPDGLSRQITEVLKFHVGGFAVFSCEILRENPEFLRSLTHTLQ